MISNPLIPCSFNFFTMYVFNNLATSKCSNDLVLHTTLIKYDISFTSWTPKICGPLIILWCRKFFRTSSNRKFISCMLYFLKIGKSTIAKEFSREKLITDFISPLAI